MAKTSASDIIAVPKAGGALKGLGETFSPDLHTGTGNFTIPIAVPPGRNGFQPQLNLTYSTGNGNGPFGLGWALSVPGVACKTAKKIPRYQGSDVFVLSGAEDLVPVEHGNGFIRYRPRTEGSFARIRHYRDGSGNYWQVKTRDGLTSLYGTPRPTSASPDWVDPAVVRDPDPEKSDHVFGWKLTRTLDPFGNRIEYAYERDAPTVDGPHRWDQVYLSEIRYVDYGDDPEQPNFLVSVRFVYELRPDPFSDYRAGFEIRTVRRCVRIEVYTQAADPILTRTYRLIYQDQLPGARLAANGVSLLSRVQVIGHDGAKTEELPPLDFGYSEFQPNRRNLMTVAGEAFPPASLAHADFELVDVTGNGLPDLVEIGNGARFWPNAGAGSFDLPREMTLAPGGFRLSDPGVQMLDANGDGRPDLMVTNEIMAGYFPLRFGGEWDENAFRPYRSAPSFNLEDSEVRLIDLDGDGVTDAMRAGDRLECYFNDPERGWEETLRLEPPDTEFPRSFADPRVKLADMTGDGSQDVIVIFDQNVQYWPHLGYGRWADRVDMRNCPELPYGYDPRRLLLGDVDGDGVADLVYVGDTEITVWINRSGNAWAEPVTISGTPPVNDFDAVRLADLLGNGVSGVLWSSDAGVLARPSMVYLDLTGGTKPYLLHEMTNNMGATTRVAYASSTRFYLEDQKHFRTRWKTPLPFPVQVVARVEIIDEFSRGKLTTDYIYHNGYWDGAEREFCGFGRVDQRDTEMFENYHDAGLHPDRTFAAVDIRVFSPPTETRTWFHQGPVGDEFGEWEEVNFSSEYWSEDPQVLLRPRAMQELLASLPRRVKRDALRACRGQVLRTELYALDGSEREDRPYTVTEHLYGVREEELPDGNDDSDRKHIFFAHPLGERITQWERGSDPMTQFSFSGDYTAYGLTRSQISAAVPRHRDYLEKIPASVSAPEKYLSTHGVIDYAERDDDQVYIVDRVARSTSFEVDNDGRDDLFTLKRDIEKGKYDTDDKLIGQTVNYFDDDSTQPSGGAFLGLPFKQIGTYGALTRTETLVLTPRILAEAYKSGDSVANPPELPPYLVPGAAPQWTADYPVEFRNGMPALAGYGHYDGSDAVHAAGYFSPTNRTRFDFHDVTILRPKGLSLASRDAVGNETAVQYDRFEFLPKRTTDSVALSTEAEYGDYRVFQSREIIDPNGNRSVFSFSPLGLVESTFVRGKTSAEGDWARPSVQMEYGFLAYHQSPPDSRQPIHVLAVRQVHHDTEIGVSQREQDETIETIEYSDGFGRLLQTRTQSEEVLFGDSVFGGDIITTDQSIPVGDVVGRERVPGAPPNVVVSGWQIYNNKGKVIEKFEPFFDQGWDHARPKAVNFGASVTMFYDPRGQAVRTLNPDGSEQHLVNGVPGAIATPDLSDPRVFEPTPWEAYTYDANDNARRTHAGNPKVKQYDHHWDTPTSITIDALGRTIETVARNRDKLPNGSFSPIEEIRTRSTYDIHGNPIAVTDALNRVVFRHAYDLAKSALRIESIDAGVRRSVCDAAGNVLERRDSKGAVILRAFDALHRPTRVWARDSGDEAITSRERLEYGDGGDAGQSAADRAENENVSRLGKLSKHYDEAGLLTLEAYDFKGNVLEKTRQVISDAAILQVFNSPLPDGTIGAFRVDWDDPGHSSLDPQIYETSVRYDALNRTKQLIYPRDVEGQRRDLHPKFNRAGALESVVFGGEVYVDHIAYNAKGQRALVAYGNGVMTRHAYDPRTFRLQRLRTDRYAMAGQTYQPTGEPLQDLAYEYDLSGNITCIRDRAPRCGIANTLLGINSLDRIFRYDPLYRLSSATGRETDLPPDRPWEDTWRSTDVTRTRPYTERYRYDAAGNIQQLRHLTDGSGFSRGFTLAVDNNRLDTLSVGATEYKYEHDVNGNMIGETKSRHFEWDHSDRMRAFRTQVGANGPTLHVHYIYDAAGLRLKKLIRKQGGQLDIAICIDGIFEIHHIEQGDTVEENNTLHVMDKDGRIALIRVGGPFANETTPAVKFQLSDHLGNSNLVVGSDGQMINCEEYTPYGETSFGSFARKRFRLAGKERDEESGLYYFGARYFSPWMVRWILP